MRKSETAILPLEVYRADLWYRDTEFSAAEPARWHVVGPDIAGGWHGTVPQSHFGMTRDDAMKLANLMNLAYRAGNSDAKAAIRKSLGL